MRDREVNSQDIGPEGFTGWLLEKEWAPCRHGCPVHADVRTYIEHAASGDLAGAIDVIREQLPFAAVCGRICHHPCEDNCRREEVDEPVAIREVKRFVAETQGAQGASLHPIGAPSGKKVAIIGAGPSGMSAALELAKYGHSPVVFDRDSVAGGIPATTIPAYRLPPDSVRMDVEWICAHGVELRLGVDIGNDVTIEHLLVSEGFDSVLIAAGLSFSRKLPIAGADHHRAYPVLDYLQTVKKGKRPDIGDDVVVIGAGDVAMDAARTSVRLGAENVKILCLENEEEIPAYEWELREAREEGVEVIQRRGPVRIKTDSKNAIIGLEARKVTRVFDESGNFSPQYDDSDVVEVSADTVIFAIGQAPDPGYAAGSALEVDERGRISWNPDTCQTDIENIFACGEIVTPPGSVVEACESGKTAAKAIDSFLSGTKIDLGKEFPREIESLPERNAENIISRDRMPVPTLSPEKRTCSFSSFQSTYVPDVAVSEARRCMSCGGGAEVLIDKCSACLTCLRVCPFDAPVVTDVAEIASEGCQACGICEAECPSNAIVMKRYDRDCLKVKTKQAIDAGSDVVAYIGGFRASAAEWRGESGDELPGMAEIYLTATASVGVSDLLYAFEIGAKGVLVIPCSSGNDRYPMVAARTGRRVAQARKLLAESGIDASALLMAEAADEGRSAVVSILKDFMNNNSFQK